MASGKEVTISIAVVALVVLNMICFFTIGRTAITTVTFWLFSWIIALPLILILFAKLGTHEDFKKRLLKSFVGGYVISFLCLSAIPYAINYFGADANPIGFSTSNFRIYEDIDRDEFDKDRRYSYDYQWEHNGVYFEFGSADFDGDREIYYEMHNGLLGFPVLKKWEVK